MQTTRTQLPLVHITAQTHDVIIDMMYANPTNFTGKVVYPHALCFLHPQAEAALRRAALAVRAFGLRLKVFDAFRPQEAQEALWAFMPNPQYVADPATGSNHTRGVAVDLTLVDSLGKELDMGTPVDTMTPASHHFHPSVDAAVQFNRIRLMTIMLEAGFLHHPHEWWHYQLPDADGFALISHAEFERCVAAAGESST